MLLISSLFVQVSNCFEMCVILCRSYVGHGGGNKYLSGESLQASECRAVALLMGCSSGKLTSAGQLDAAGLMLNYFLGGW